jgi:hypothetical protein
MRGDSCKLWSKSIEASNDQSASDISTISKEMVAKSGHNLINSRLAASVKPLQLKLSMLTMGNVL